MFCPNCGNELQENAKFCGKCGSVVEPPEGTSARLASPQIIVNESAATFEGAVPNAEYPATGEAVDGVTPSSNHGDRKKIIAIAAIVVAVIAIVAIVAFVLWNQEQERLSNERLAEVQQIVGEHERAIAAIEVDTSGAAERAVLLQQYETADAELVAIQEAAEGDELVLFDGSVYDTSSLEDKLKEKMDAIRQWFIDDYEKRIAADTLSEEANADNTSRESCQALLDDLTALLAQMEQEAVIWDGETGEGTPYAQLVAKANAATTRDNAVLQQIAEREEQARIARQNPSSVNAVNGAVTLKGTLVRKQRTTDETGMGWASVDYLLVFESPVSITYKNSDGSIVTHSFSEIQVGSQEIYIAVDPDANSKLSSTNNPTYQPYVGKFVAVTGTIYNSGTMHTYGYARFGDCTISVI